MNYLSMYDILSPHQSGFRVGNSTEHVLVKTIDDWCEAVDRG